MGRLRPPFLFMTLNALIQLTKAKITIFVAITAIAGYIFSTGALAWVLVPMTLGLFLLASGSATYNEYQEHATDLHMPRTQDRPIPSGAISPQAAALLATGLIVSGLLILLYAVNVTAFGLGLLALFWYNGVYLFLKRRTAFAVVPGSLVGAFGPLIGWAAAEGSFHDPKIWALAIFFFIWQIPHFWLLLLKYGKEYETIGYPSLTARLEMSQLRRMTVVWIAATVVTSLLIPFTGGLHAISSYVSWVLLGVVLVWRSCAVLNAAEPKQFMRAFIDINIYALLLTVIVSIDALTR